jgi:hypothetical protein
MARRSLAKVSAEELKKEIGRRQRKLPALIAARDELNCRIAELETLVGAAPAAVARKRRRRRKRARRMVKPARKGSLTSVLEKAFGRKGKLTVAEAAKAAVAAGYRSKSKDFGNIVSMALAKDKRFRRVRRGLYALRGR